MKVELTTVGKVLTRTSGYLDSLTSHSLNPYRGCPYGSSLCGVGCYVRHNPWVTRGRAWGSFLEVRQNAAESYLAHVSKERRWARRHRSDFSIFLASSTEPFPPQESRYLVTRKVLEAMLNEPPDFLVVQTHSSNVVDQVDVLHRLNERCRVQCNVSIETDRNDLPELPNHGSSVEKRFDAARRLKDAGLPTLITVAPLLPIADPDSFFQRVAESAHAVCLDHFIGGDGTPDGRRTRRTRLPEAMELVEPSSSELAYRGRMERVARRHLERVGVGAEGFIIRC